MTYVNEYIRLRAGKPLSMFPQESSRKSALKAMSERLHFSSEATSAPSARERKELSLG